MHYHLEILMPPTDDVHGSVSEVLEPFNKCPKRRDDEEDEDGNERYSFWDWWEIGGRWSGSKLEATLDSAKVEAFHEALTARDVTVSGVQFGKQTLDPPDQISMVDALWKEFFPDWPEAHCPLFKHAGDQIVGDVMPFNQVPPELTMSRFIHAFRFQDWGLKASTMLADSIYNGVSWQDTQFDGTFGSAMDEVARWGKNCSDEYREASTPREDWLVVTVDYHS